MYFKYTDCSTAYYRSAHFNERPIISKAIKEKYKRTKRYRTVYGKYPSLAKNRGDHCSSPDIADHPSDTPRLLLSPSVSGSANCRKVEKHDRRAVGKTNAKGKKTNKAKTTVQYRRNISLRRKEFCISKLFSCRTVCFGRLTTLPSFAAAAFQ